MRIVRVDGSPAAVEGLTAAVADALDGGPAVQPLAADAPVPAALGDAGTDGVATGSVLVATSGSTGEPRLVVLPAAALRASAAATERRLGGPARWLLALPADHVAGVQVIVRALLARAAPEPACGAGAAGRGPLDGPVALDLRAGFRPDAFAAASAALGPGRRCTSLVPTQLLRLLDAGGAPLDALRAYAAVLIGGAALDPRLRARAEAAGVRVVATYGMTETAGGCVYDGVPLDGVHVHLDGGGDAGGGNADCQDARRQDARRLDARRQDADREDANREDAGRGDAGVGRIVLGGPTLAAGYLGRPAETAAAFGPAPGPGGRGRFFRTSDLGRWVGDRLEVVGRVDDVIVTGGEKVAPAAVERVLAAQPGVRAACVVGLPDPEWGAVVAAAVERDPTGGPAGDPADWQAAVAAALGRAAVPRVLRAVDALPLRGIGKPDRAAVTRLLAAVSRSRPGV